ncbi:MAG: helix-turn-helix transcriptional regulator [Firmicutes bacterium]|nr:helix-turn-helix transcriptional regulator [Bacillota bacterium]
MGENVKKFRKKANMSQRELATKVLVSNTVISNIEQDKTSPSLQLTVFIADVLGCTVDDLIKEK